MKIGSLFTGIGGIDLGLEWSGLGKVVWQCEPEPVCRDILKRHWPEIPCYNDVHDIDESVEPVEVLCGGFPCQDVSQAGKRVGITGQRSGLWREFARCIRILRPKYVIVENVQGLINRGLDDVLGDLASLGYDAEWTVLRAFDYGAPHRRPRLFIVAYPRGVGFEVFRERDHEDWRDAHRDFSSRRSTFFPPGPDEASGLWDSWVGATGVTPGLHRVSNGFPRRMDRVRVLGNSVLPIVAEAVGEALRREIEEKG